MLALKPFFGRSFGAHVICASSPHDSAPQFLNKATSSLLTEHYIYLQIGISLIAAKYLGYSLKYNYSHLNMAKLI